MNIIGTATVPEAGSTIVSTPTHEQVVTASVSVIRPSVSVIGPSL